MELTKKSSTSEMETRKTPIEGEKGESELLVQRTEEITAYVREKLSHLDESEQKRTIERAVNLYECSRETIAPVFAAFADHLLRLAAKKGERERIMFIARDGIGPYKAALALIRKYPERYQGIVSKQISYAYLTRKVVRNSSGEILAKYFEQLGVQPGDGVILADIGMYGTIIGPIKSKLPDFSIDSIEYLISRTSEANGFIDNGNDLQLSTFKTIIGNPAVHFLEDTFSGDIQSPTLLEDVDGELQPDTLNSGYPPEIDLKRKFALQAIEDFVENTPDKEANRDAKKTRANLDKFLSNPGNFKDLMVPHEA